MSDSPVIQAELPKPDPTPSPESGVSGFQRMRRRIRRSRRRNAQYWLTRFVFLRFLGFVYLFAFLSLANQVLPLIGSHGLTPAHKYLTNIRAAGLPESEIWTKLPTLFLWRISDTLLVDLAWFGVAMSVVVLIGFANAPLMSALWFLYMSFVHIGQIWYGYGWEIQLLETGFLAIFIVPPLDPRPFPRHEPPRPIIWLLRCLIVRIMLGAGLIKIRGDSCWRDLTCLCYHYETQPIPNPLSRLFHFQPQWAHKIGCLFNHLVELIAPIFAFWPPIARRIAGMLFVTFQLILILSGNLSFLNWLTICPALACLDDRVWRRVLPRRLVLRAVRAKVHAKSSRIHTILVWLLLPLVGYLTYAPVRNMMSPHQIMNTSFNSLHLVNTYGAFGSVGRSRDEIILEGTTDTRIGPNTLWRAYEFPAKPGDPARCPPFIAPYQPRLDWQIWFAAMSTPQRHPWLIHVIWNLLHNDRLTLSLLANNPFLDAPPRYIRAELYRYHFTKPFSGAATYWTRERIGSWLPPMSLDNPNLRQLARSRGWE